MSDKQFAALSKIIHERSGIHFAPAKKYILESRLGSRLAELEIQNYDQYISFLSFGPYKDDEFQELFNRVTINETSFFRNEPQLDVFEKQTLPELMEKRKATRTLRIWSAACSSGEEPYTLAILVHRTLGVRAADWKVEILGTDISERVLNIAQEGRYTEYSVRTTPELVRGRYFKRDGAYWIISDLIKPMVSFELHNLNDRAAMRRHGLWDVIFCRNVLIYFDDAMRRQTFSLFAERLAPDGTLFIGHSETIKPGDAPFAALPIPQGFCYRKAA